MWIDSLDITRDPELLGTLVEIARNTATITYYIASSTRAWHHILSFIESNMFILSVFLGGIVGYFIGAKNDKWKK